MSSRRSDLAYLEWHNAANGGSLANEEPIVTAQVVYGTATDWLANWVLVVRLVQGCIEVIEGLADEGMANCLSHSMAHLLLANKLSTNAEKYATCNVKTPGSGTRTATTNKTPAAIKTAPARAPASVMPILPAEPKPTAAPRGAQPTALLSSPQRTVVEIAPVAFTGPATLIGDSDSTAAKAIALVAAEAAFNPPELQADARVANLGMDM
ncbi:hypothetical protein DL768_008655 [Monosporascus sp. mg162]|nr:hypothetical protein DL768_008655 [Monosporascus sp. mg162]